MLSLGNFYSGQTYFPDVLQRRRKEDLLFVKAVSQERLGCTQDLEAGAEGWGAPGTWRLELLTRVHPGPGG